MGKMSERIPSKQTKISELFLKKNVEATVFGKMIDVTMLLNSTSSSEASREENKADETVRKIRPGPKSSKEKSEKRSSERFNKSNSENVVKSSVKTPEAPLKPETIPGDAENLLEPLEKVKQRQKRRLPGSAPQVQSKRRKVSHKAKTKSAAVTIKENLDVSMKNVEGWYFFFEKL